MVLCLSEVRHATGLSFHARVYPDEHGAVPWPIILRSLWKPEAKACSRVSQTVEPGMMIQKVARRRLVVKAFQKLFLPFLCITIIRGTWSSAEWPIKLQWPSLNFSATLARKLFEQAVQIDCLQFSQPFVSTCATIINTSRKKTRLAAG